MSRPLHYSPALSRFMVSVLYHEAQQRKIPMTRLTDELLRTALRGSAGWSMAENLAKAAETATGVPSSAHAG